MHMLNSRETLGVYNHLGPIRLYKRFQFRCRLQIQLHELTSNSLQPDPVTPSSPSSKLTNGTSITQYFPIS